MKKVIILLADGVEEVEALTQVDYLRRAGMEVVMVSANDGLSVTGAHNIRFKAEEFVEDILEKISTEEYDGVIVPGGIKGVENLIANEQVIELIKKMNAKNNLIAAITAPGPAYAQKLAFKIVRYLLEREDVKNLKNDVLYKKY